MDANKDKPKHIELNAMCGNFTPWLRDCVELARNDGTPQELALPLEELVRARLANMVRALDQYHTELRSGVETIHAVAQELLELGLSAPDPSSSTHTADQAPTKQPASSAEFARFQRNETTTHGSRPHQATPRPKAHASPHSDHSDSESEITLPYATTAPASNQDSAPTPIPPALASEHAKALLKLRMFEAKRPVVQQFHAETIQKVTEARARRQLTAMFDRMPISLAEPLRRTGFTEPYKLLAALQQMSLKQINADALEVLEKEYRNTFYDNKFPTFGKFIEEF